MYMSVGWRSLSCPLRERFWRSRLSFSRYSTRAAEGGGGGGGWGGGGGGLGVKELNDSTWLCQEGRMGTTTTEYF